MKAKRKATKATRRPRPGTWRMEDLPVRFQLELRDRMAQAKRGEDLQDFHEALAEADRLTDEMLAVVARPRRRSTK